MRVLVISDIHDHIANLGQVIEQQRGHVQAVICCGDLCAPFTAGILKKMEVPTYVCLGNNDEDHICLLKKGGDNLEWTSLAEEFGEIELGGKKIAFCHYPKLSELLAKSGEHDAVFYGHTHEAKNEKFNETLLVNPGAVCGIVNGSYGTASYAMYDTENNSAEIIDLHWNWGIEEDVSGLVE